MLELETDVSPAHVPSYDARILNRKGVLSINAIGDMDQLDNVGPAMESLLARVTFETGTATMISIRTPTR
jgi:uncharacterized membrane-anchored protein